MLHLICTPVFLFLAQTDTNTIHFVQVHNVLSAFINKNSSCDPYLQKGKKRSQNCYDQMQIQISLMKTWNPSEFQNRKLLKYSQLNITITITGLKFSFLILTENYFSCQWKFCIRWKYRINKKYLKPSSCHLLNFVGHVLAALSFLNASDVRSRLNLGL